MELNFENETQDDSIVNYLSDRIQLIEEEEKPITKVYKLKTNDTYKIIEYFLKLGESKFCGHCIAMVSSFILFVLLL